MPGSYFGENGKGHVRVTLFQPKPVIEEALRRINEIRDW
jgi:aspartate/methionine/tyrosine aminotransferase